MNVFDFADSVGVKLYPEWRAILHTFFDTSMDYKELICCMGMKSGKTYMAGFLCCYEMYLLSCLDNPAVTFNLDPDSWIYGICAARNRDQAKTGVFAEFLAKANRCASFQDLGPESSSFNYKLNDKKLSFLSGPSNSDALVSHTLAFAVLDEMSLFKTAGGERSAKSVYEAVSHQLGLLDGRLYVISSPVYVNDWTMILLEMAKNNERMLGYQMPTWLMNPNMPRGHPKIIDAFNKNPEAANRDYGAQPSLALQPFFRKTQMLDMCIVPELRHPLDAHGIPHTWYTPLPGTTYVAAGDPAYKNDSFGFALVHRRGRKFVATLMHRFFELHGEIDAEDPKNLVLGLKDLGFPITHFVFDTWQFPETIQAISRKGIETIRRTVDLSVYSYFKELVYSGRFEMYRHDYALSEMKSLELVRGAKVDHRSGFTKDISDAVANACYQLMDPMEEKLDTKILRA